MADRNRTITIKFKGDERDALKSIERLERAAKRLNSPTRSSGFSQVSTLSNQQLREVQHIAKERSRRNESLPVTSGKTVADVLDNLKMLINDYMLHEGQNDDFWKNISVNDIDFICVKELAE